LYAIYLSRALARTPTAAVRDLGLPTVSCTSLYMMDNTVKGDFWNWCSNKDIPSLFPLWESKVQDLVTIYRHCATTCSSQESMWYI